MTFVDWRGIPRPNEGTMIYHRQPAPVSIDLLRKFLNEGWTPVAWTDAGYLFSFDLGRSNQKCRV